MNRVFLYPVLTLILVTGIIAGCGSKATPPSIEDAQIRTAFTGATVDNAVFRYPIWFDQVVEKIYDNFISSREYDDALVCVVRFQVVRPGRAVHLEVQESSGFKEYDEACLAAVERSAPFSPLPRDFREDTIGVRVPLRWTPR